MEKNYRKYSQHKRRSKSRRKGRCLCENELQWHYNLYPDNRTARDGYPKRYRGYQPIIEPTGSTVNLENLPDFLEDDATELDITNPIFTFIAKNPLEAPIVLNGTMQGEKMAV